MAYLVWQDDLNTGIQVIDNQHKRIVEMINQLHEAQGTLDKARVGEVIEELVDYTQSHFAFEETLLEDSGYQFTRAHKKVHELFIKRVSDYRLRFAAGEDVAEELKGLLGRWLFTHIRNDDANYVESVKASMHELTRDQGHGGWLSRSMKRFFG
ncbi:MULTISPECIES: bacteriohemerythrin [Pseudomonas]|uniref:Bacteriohemerythrin n=1 Tax=Pseudomonas delhiensis TaxID=366289 RepID=A0A239NCN4_9PSED|nr:MULTISPECIES: bacteriohemerythrin [Pseudomonas]MED5608828.1 bacteriohemerythrin [Pseudomonas sp. JH-2]PWU30370.1 bacteriohemerythrin [Pseudomonas sp. RW407]SDK63915.1 hemerythrin [Pseudomonas delhiensis]SNT52262.1 hemerythrin [Pseudomonas delhiensis]